MSIVFAAIAPHGFAIIPTISEDAEGAMKTRAAMEELGRRFNAAQVDTIVLGGPHGIRVGGAIAVSTARTASGTFGHKGRSVSINAPIDLELAQAIAAASRDDGVPAAEVSWAGNRVSQAAYPITWDSITPLWFLGHGGNTSATDVLDVAADDGPAVVICAPSRDLPRDAMVQFGRSVARAAEASDKRVAFIASCDWAHTHKETGPYGAHPDAAPVDAKVVQAIKDNDLKRMLQFSDAEVENAAIDGMWQALMLAGVQESVALKPDLLSYEAPDYFGMIVASYTPA